MEKHVKVFSFGGGVQSHAVLVLQAHGKLPTPFDYFVFANVGEDSENPETLEYMEKYTIPFAEEFNIPLVTVRKTTHGKPETLKEYIFRTKRSIPIPARMSNGAPGNRSCTNDFKIKPVDNWVKSNGYTHGTIGLGISTDEIQRMRDEQWHTHHGKTKIGYTKRRYHPLIDLGINRTGCHSIIEEAGLPQPPKSSCYFCPFKKRNEWIEMKRRRPDLFDAAVDIENHINEKRNAIGKDRVFLHSSTQPLEQAVADQLSLFGDEVLDECGGYCWT